MKKIKVAFAALSAVAGIGGAYATTIHNDSNSSRAGQTYNWYSCEPGSGVIYGNTTVATAERFSGCNLVNLNCCLRGTHPGLPSVTLFKP
ncbi:hypothetical protein [Chitinophaga flava]|uniref:hypothetical protein n=1 Tax=Chitinophaga flava TaxID=2259036 RepID=UPI0011BFCFAC|nr:hypothetical protein [Chitinophaga flava]